MLLESVQDQCPFFGKQAAKDFVYLDWGNRIALSGLSSREPRWSFLI